MSDAELAASQVTDPELKARLDALHRLLSDIRGSYISQALVYECLVEAIVAHHLAPNRVSFFKAVVFEDMTMLPKLKMLKRVMQDLGVQGEFKGLRRALDDCMKFRNVLAHGQVCFTEETIRQRDSVTILVYDDGGERQITLTQEDVLQRLKAERSIVEDLYRLGSTTGAITVGTSE